MPINANGTLYCNNGQGVGWGDISKVTHIPVNPSYDLGYMITHGYIKEMAKWKPVVFANFWGVLSEANRASTRYGFGTNLPAITWSLNKISAPTWTYTRPSGGSASPFRSTDFVKNLSTTTEGYNEKVGAPISLNLAGSTVISAMGTLVELKFNKMAYTPFDANYNLSAADLLGSGGNSYLHYNIALILEFFDRATPTFCLVVYNQTVGSVVNNSTPVAALPLSQNGETGMPAISELANCAPGEKIRVIACLSTGRTITSGNAYAVFTSFTNEVSLAFLKDADRKEFDYMAAGNDWSHISASISLTRGSHSIDPQMGMDVSDVSGSVTVVADQYWLGTAFNIELEVIPEDGGNFILKNDEPYDQSILLTPQQIDPDASSSVTRAYNDLANIQLISYPEDSATYDFILYGYFTDQYDRKVELCRGTLTYNF